MKRACFLARWYVIAHIENRLPDGQTWCAWVLFLFVIETLDAEAKFPSIRLLIDAKQTPPKRGVRQ